MNAKMPTIEGVSDLRSFPPPTIRQPLAKLSLFGVVALVDLAQGTVTWFLGKAGPSLQPIVGAARLACLPGAATTAAYEGYVVGQVHFPYVVVLEIANAATPSRELTGFVADVCSDLRGVLSIPEMPTTRGGGGSPPTGAAPAPVGVQLPPSPPPIGDEGAA